MFDYKFTTNEKIVKDEKNGDLIHLNEDGEIIEQFNSAGTLIFKVREYDTYLYDDRIYNIDKFWYGVDYCGYSV